MQAALVAIENGYQAALMAPTEILATQHYLSARKLLADAISPSTGKPYRVALLTGSLDDRDQARDPGPHHARRGQFVIGTHALRRTRPTSPTSASSSSTSSTASACSSASS
jgi:ATP-dependent DNA helicase RecG